MTLWDMGHRGQRVWNCWYRYLGLWKRGATCYAWDRRSGRCCGSVDAPRCLPPPYPPCPCPPRRTPPRRSARPNRQPSARAPGQLPARRASQAAAWVAPRCRSCAAGVERPTPCPRSPSSCPTPAPWAGRGGGVGQGGKGAGSLPDDTPGSGGLEALRGQGPGSYDVGTVGDGSFVRPYTDDIGSLPTSVIGHRDLPTAGDLEALRERAIGSLGADTAGGGHMGGPGMEWSGS